MFKNLIIVCLFLIVPFFVEAKSYDFYVDDSASGDEDGSKENPFSEISDAIEEASKEKGKKDIFIESGEYDEKIRIKEAIRLFGKDDNKVKLFGTITMDDNSSLEGVTVSGGSPAIAVEENADVEIKNCTIENFKKIGIDIEPGKGTVVVTGSKIRDGEGKGFYIQKGNDVIITENEVYDNGEEGIDIRSNVDGKIQNNIIQENGESGIELVIGRADLKITNNNIKKNGSSGIATQFYSSADEEGEIYIGKNDIYSNSNYGVDCKIPQGGGYEKGYWSNSIEMKDNNIGKNKLGIISPRCNFKIDKIVEDEEESKESKKEKKAEEERLFQEENNRKIEEFEKSLNTQGQFFEEQKKLVDEIKNENKFKLFFQGADKEKIEKTLNSLSEIEMGIQKIQNSLSEIHFEQEREDFFRQEIDEKINKIEQEKEFLNYRKNSFSVRSWIVNLFKNIEG